MATQSRRSGAPVAKALVDQPYEFEFHEAVRLLEQLHPGWAPVGEGASPSDEPVRFRAHGELGFPASDITGVEIPDDEGPVEMDVSFMSLAGPHGPLPAPYTELIQDREREGDTALRDFLDLLAHRLIALRYRERKRHHVGMESGPPRESTVARYLRAIGGLGPNAAQGRLSVPDQTLLRYAPLLNQRPASAHGLSVLLGDYFDLEVDVTPLTGRWLELDADQETRIGVAGQNQALGQSAVLGRRAWDQQAGLTVEVRMSSYDDYLSFFPGGEAHRALVDLSTLYLGRTIDLDVDLTLNTADAPQTPLSSLLGPRLGQDAWVGSPSGDTDTTRVQPQTFTPAQEVLRIPLFAELSPGQLQEVVDQLSEHDVDGRQHVARQGRPADAFYLLVDGEAEVRYESPESEDFTVLTVLEPGGVFGDRAMIQEGTYDGSLVTTRSSRFLIVRASMLEALVDQYPALERAFEEEYGRSGSAGAERDEGDSAPADAEGPPTGLGALFPVSMWRPFYRRGTKRTVASGTPLVETDTAPPSLHVLLRGGVQADTGEQINTPGTPLNLEALVAGEAPSTALRTTEETTELVLSRADLRRLIQKHAAIERSLRAWRASARTDSSPST
ncbi:MAG: type VI secretion system baseplate subunit TssG [Candidatus Bipolaricaulia bacterium]